jgi:hypothetical protein
MVLERGIGFRDLVTSGLVKSRAGENGDGYCRSGLPLAMGPYLEVTALRRRV